MDVSNHLYNTQGASMPHVTSACALFSAVLTHILLMENLTITAALKSVMPSEMAYATMVMIFFIGVLLFWQMGENLVRLCLTEMRYNYITRNQKKGRWREYGEFLSRFWRA